MNKCNAHGFAYSFMCYVLLRTCKKVHNIYINNETRFTDDTVHIYVSNTFFVSIISRSLCKYIITCNLVKSTRIQLN